MIENWGFWNRAFSVLRSAGLFVVGVVGATAVAYTVMQVTGYADNMVDSRATTIPDVSEASTDSGATRKMSEILNDYEHDPDTNTYSVGTDDYAKLFGGDLTDEGEGLRSATLQNNGETWNVYCYTYSSSCSVSTSTGVYGNIHCYNSSKSCSYSDSEGNYSSTYCYNTSSCMTSGSDGYSSNTYCSQHSNACSTYDSNGGYSNTYCSTYSSTCSTYGSDGSTTNTYCSSYLSGCMSNSYGGDSSSFGGW